MDTRPLTQPFNQKKRLIVVQIGAILASALMLVSQPAWNQASGTHEFVELTGLGLVILCILGRLWTILYVGDRKNAELVTDGPYSMSRNPLYFFSTLGAAGIGLMFGSVLAAAVLGWLTYKIFIVTARKESGFLISRFGLNYEAYARRTPMFWPNPLRYRDASEVRFSPRNLKRTFVDCLYFLAVFPAIELVEYLQSVGVFPVLLSVY